MLPDMVRHQSSDKRRVQREPLPDLIAILHHDGSASAACGVDFSTDGVCFTFGSEMPKGSEIDLLIPTGCQVLRRRGTIVRARFDWRTGSFSTAVAFNSGIQPHRTFKAAA